MYSAYSTKDCFIGDIFSHFFQNRLVLLYLLRQLIIGVNMAPKFCIIHQKKRLTGIRHSFVF